MKKLLFFSIISVIIILISVVVLINFQIKSGTNETMNGILRGKVSIGPLCPVVQYPPNPKCQPTEKTYKAWPIAVYTPDKETKIAQIKPNLDGTYKIKLPVGNYIVDIEKQQPFRIGGNNLPATITINSGKITILNINIDTGIR